MALFTDRVVIIKINNHNNEFVGSVCGHFSKIIQYLSFGCYVEVVPSSEDSFVSTHQFSIANKCPTHLFRLREFRHELSVELDNTE